MRVPFDRLKAEFVRVLRDRGVNADTAELSGRLFAENSLDGVYSHGLNRFPKIVGLIDQGHILPNTEPEVVASLGGFEKWDGHLGLGNVTATKAMSRAVELARGHGIGCVAVRNTNHWLRGGTYGWQAAQAGCVGICWTNAIANMPAWGGREPRIGNNPLVFAVPRDEGHVVVDTALSQFSFGQIEQYRLRGEQLPYPGGYDQEGHLTTDPASIEQTMNALPIGYWKGSGLSVLLDLMAAVLSGGKSAKHYREQGAEYGVSQVFIALDMDNITEHDLRERIVDETLDYIHSATPVAEGGRIYYPGERTLLTRRDNQANGIPVNEKIWEQVRGM